MHSDIVSDTNELESRLLHSEHGTFLDEVLKEGRGDATALSMTFDFCSLFCAVLFSSLFFFPKLGQYKSRGKAFVPI